MAHFDGRRYFNPTGANGQPFWALPRLLRTTWTPWPRSVPTHPRRPPEAVGAGEAVATFIGHATFLIQTAAGNILTDPMYSERAGPLTFFGPRRVRCPGVAFEDLPPISVVVVSHNHYDHFDRRTLQVLGRRFDPLVVTPLGNGRLLQAAGIRRVEELDWWQETTASSPLAVTVTPAQHFSARTPFDRNRALWGGFVIAVNGRRIFFAGDSGYGPHFRDLRRRCGAVDLALLPIGAYEPRWFMKDVHMNPAEAVQVHLDLEAQQTIAMHFGTFRLTAEGISDPVVALQEALRSRDVPASRFRTLEPGESVKLGFPQRENP